MRNPQRVAVAALVMPLRAGSQAVTYRRFSRARHDAACTLEACTVRLLDELDLKILGTSLRRVHDTMPAAHRSHWLHEAG